MNSDHQAKADSDNNFLDKLKEGLEEEFGGDMHYFTNQSLLASAFGLPWQVAIVSAMLKQKLKSKLVLKVIIGVKVQVDKSKS